MTSWSTLPAVVEPLQAADHRSPVAEITVDLSHPEGLVNPLIFGNNIEAGDSAGIFGNSTQVGALRTGNGFWNPDLQAPSATAVLKAREIGIKLLRYPGGCLAHNFDWRKAVGPLSSRGDWKFGIDEFFTLCGAIGAEPMITVSDYVLPAEQMPRHAAELVEYLNAEATPDHPWACKRKQWGHPAPYGAKWFELGNESVHGNHACVPHRQFSPEDYAAYANATAKAMRAIDPSIKIGIVTVPGPLQDADGDWNRTIVHLAGASADFVVVHLYAPDRVNDVSEENLMAACMALPDQIGSRLQQFHQMITRECGRDLPLAMTEYNINAIQDSPKPYRFSMGAALMCADLIRVFLDPKNHMATANYWQFIGGFWGMIDEAPGKAVKPAFDFFRLWGQHFGTQLLNVKVNGPKGSTAAMAGIDEAARDTFDPGGKVIASLDAKKLAEISKLPQPSATVEPSVDQLGNFAFAIHHPAHEEYLDFATITKPESAGGGWSCRLSYEARFTGDRNELAQVGLGIADSRGYATTRSALAASSAAGADWKKFTAEFRPLPDAPGVTLNARLLDKSITDGRFEVRNLHLEILDGPHLAKFPLLTAAASWSLDKSKLYLIVFNKDPAADIETTLSFSENEPSLGHVWEVNGPGFGAITGVSETKSGTEIRPAEGRFKYIFPAHSMTAIEFTAK